MTRTIPEDDRIALNALADGELDTATASTLVARLAADADLQQAYDTIVATRDALGGLELPVVPLEFLARIENLATPSPADSPLLRPRHYRWEGWRNIAASVLVTALIASSATYLFTSPRGPSLEQMVASAHRRSLLAANPVDVLSSDRHTVKPWLDQHLGVSPPAPDLAAAGYPLLGGRVEVLGQQALPTLVYRHNEHTISVVAQPGSTTTAAPRSLASGGYNMVEWSIAGFDFTAASDLEPAELATFVAAYLKAAG